MREFFHGSPAQLKPGDLLTTPNNVKCWDVTKGGVVYITSDVNVAKKYGNVYVVEPLGEVREYAVQRKNQGLKEKKRCFTRNIYVALSGEVRVLGFLK